ncbi:TOBE domain-containing protein [Kineococcus sp. SYSU DK005]|uniref:TOBE domain-containing protein n=1 Tax=Kineococcus sp. SYSU DK005 TaxID=3383126 RepID=UPI003D7CB87E
MPARGAANRWPVVVEQLQPRGRTVRVQGRCGPLELFADVPVEAVAAARLAPGDEVRFEAGAAAVRVHPAPGPQHG